MRLNHSDPNQPFKDYDGYQNDSFFSGILVKYNNDGDSLKAASYYS